MKKLRDVLSEHKNELVIIIILLFAVSVSWIFWGYDNPLEEATEELIKIKTNKDIDLSPHNPDPNIRIKGRKDI